MRVISGKYRGRLLKAVRGRHTRPTSDKVKESMFNIIGPYFNGGVALDLYAGTGSLSIEAISRGISEAYLVDYQYEAIKVIQHNILLTTSLDAFHVFKLNANKFLDEFKNRNVKFNYVFLDPPYKFQRIESDLYKLCKYNMLASKALIICETDSSIDLSISSKSFLCLKHVIYGTTSLIIYMYKGV